MKVEINTDKTLIGEDRMREYFSSQVRESLKRYQSYITRVTIHLKDENGNKDGLNDMSCNLEARLKGRKPIAVTCRADTVELALSGAVDKMETVVKTIVGRIKNH